MRKVPRVAFVLLCTAITMFSQNTTPPTVSDNAGVEQQVKQLEQQIRSQVVKGEVSGLDQYLADDYVSINPAGQLFDKGESIQMIKTGRVKYTSIDVKDERVRTYGNTAILNGLANTKLTVDGQDRSGDYRVTIVWVKQNGQWKRVSFQSTRVLSDMK